MSEFDDVSKEKGSHTSENISSDPSTDTEVGIVKEPISADEELLENIGYKQVWLMNLYLTKSSR